MGIARGCVGWDDGIINAKVTAFEPLPSHTSCLIISSDRRGRKTGGSPRIIDGKWRMTQEQVMKDSRRLLFIMAALFLVWGVAIVFRQESPYPGMRHDVVVVVLLGIICAVAGITRSFWFRLGCIAVFLLGTLFVLLSAQGTGTVVFLFVLVAANLIYRMLKYRGVQEEPDVLVEENPLTPLMQSSTFPNVSRRTLIIAVVLIISAIIIMPWVERLSADWSREAEKNQKSQGTRAK
jgi:hypothetical protein